MSRSDWRPSAPLSALRARARALDAARRFFAERSVLEVDTPALLRHAVTDLHLHALAVPLPGAGTHYLQTSPEYAMKRLLAAGSGDIFQIAHAFRAGESSPLHSPEFTLIEWYRCGFDLHRLIDEVAALLSALLESIDGGNAAPPAPPGRRAVPEHAGLLAHPERTERLSYAQAFERTLGCDPLSASDTQLRALAQAQQLDPEAAQRCTRDELLDWLMASRVGPGLGAHGLCFLCGYPASQAALARLDARDPRLALRFELYWHGVELANGFDELADAGEQRRRFEAQQRERALRGMEVPELDDALLAALDAGLPPVSGVALGLDRVLMLALGAHDIREVLAFPVGRA